MLRRIFARTVADEAENVRASIRRDNLRNLGYRSAGSVIEVQGAPWVRPAGVDDFERNLFRRHVIREDAHA